MVRITEELVRKKAEHNEREIFSLEELSLHQENIEKIEHIDKWCRDLKILYFQNNLIPKIENLGRLKKLEYVNFTLNNITRIENLEGCESLRKLDLTINFIGELTSINSLRNNYNLQEIYLTGNPCTDFEGYREYVIATLPQLTRLDGTEITKTERILAMQRYNAVHRDILEQERNYLRKQEKNLGPSRNQQEQEDGEVCHEKEKNSDEEDEERFWKELTHFTPQTRIETYKHLEKSKKQSRDVEKKKPEIPRKFILDDGRVLNCNEPKLNFFLDDDKEENSFHLDLATYRYLDTSLIDVDIQPTYVRMTVKGKVFQMVLPEEVHPDRSVAQRSQTTGHLVITMPKVKPVLRKQKKDVPKVIKRGENENDKLSRIRNKKLEIIPMKSSSLDLITREQREQHEVYESSDLQCRNNSNFVDNPEVPPLI